MSATAGPFLTLYTLPTCPHCVHTKAHLQELGVPFQAIELAPDIRDAVLKLSGRSSVPQGFISDVAPGEAAPPAEGWSLHHIKEGGEGIRALFPPETSVADALAKGLASEAVTSLPTADLSPLELVSKALPPPPPSQVLKPYTDLLSSLPAPAASLSPFSINTFYPPSTLPKPLSSPVAALHALKLLIPPAPIDGESPELKSYLDLYSLVVSSLPLPSAPLELKAFVIELYNLSIKLSPYTAGVPAATLSRLRYFDEVGVTLNVGGSPVFASYNQLENGLLRGNAKAPYHRRPSLSSKSPLLPFVQPVDYRIHAALNCGAASCPPVLHYTADNLEKDLDTAWRGWISEASGSREEEGGKAVEFSMITSWYKADFDAAGGVVKLWQDATGKDLGGRKVTNMDYDWGGGAEGVREYKAGFFATIRGIL